MEFLPPRGYKRIIVIGIYILLAVIFVRVLLRCALDIFLPFVIAWCLSMVLRPAVSWLSKRTGMPRKLICGAVVSLVLLLIGLVLFWLLRRLITEIGNMTEYLIDHYDDIVGRAEDFAEKLLSRLPRRGEQTAEGVDAVMDTAFGMLRSTLASMSARLPELAASLIRMLPDTLVFTVMLVSASFYISADLENVNRSLTALLPKGMRRLAGDAGGIMKSAGFSYLRACLILMAVTFAELLTGFLLIRIEYAVLAALLVAAADMLPVIGVGMILTPWAAVMFLHGDVYRGIGLLLIFAVCSLIRQIIEPRIVGVSIGLSPLLTLVSMYAGLRIFGFGGMILLPIAVLIGKSLIGSGALKTVAQEADAGEEIPPQEKPKT